MAKELETRKVRELREIERHGFGFSGVKVTESRIVELPKADVPETAQVVSDDTPVTDWETVAENVN